MSLKTVSGWLLADEDQGAKVKSMISELPANLARLWCFQDRNDVSPLSTTFIHFGGLLNQEDENIILRFLEEASKKAVSHYDEPEEYIEGDFFIMDTSRLESELRLRVAYGNLSVDEREPYRPHDLQC